ncbi:MAG TPA: peptide ABC transporter substrate-binding protein, partial [Caulobacteraceae bacterium]|nr:peptide ABC transporter substrate-binding protein [Caulobacteraceae bacterium]
MERAACPVGWSCLEYGNSTDPQTIDPQLAQTVNEATILRELFEGLMADGPDGAPVPGVADSWTTSADGLTWTFHLRPEVWSDGQPLTANDFVFAYRHMLDPKTGSPYAYLLYVLKGAQAANMGGALDQIGARALDDHTLQLTLEHPASYLPQLLKHQAFFPIPEHVVRRWGADWVKAGRMVSNGAYVLKDWRLGDYLRIERNPRYHGASSVCFDRVNFYALNDTVSAERRVLRGEIDINAGIQSNRVQRLRSRPDSARFVHSHPLLSTNYLIFNRRDVAPLKDLRVRQAISMAIDRTFITEKLMRAGQVPTTSFVPRDIAGYLPANEAHPAPYWSTWPLQQRQAEARRLLAAAGYGPGRPLRLELKTFNLPGSLVIPESVQADLHAVGVDVTFRQEDGAVIFQSFNNRDFQLGFAGWVADYDDPMTFLGLMKSDTGAQNYGDYKNPAYDALLKAAD